MFPIILTSELLKKKIDRRDSGAFGWGTSGTNPVLGIQTQAARCEFVFPMERLLIGNSIGNTAVRS